MADFFSNKGPTHSTEGQLSEQTLPSVGAVMRRLETFKVLTERLDESKQHLRRAQEKFGEAGSLQLTQPLTAPLSGSEAVGKLYDALLSLYLLREALHSFEPLIGEGPNRNEHLAKCLDGIKFQITRIETTTIKLAKLRTHAKTTLRHGTLVKALENACSSLTLTLNRTLEEAVIKERAGLSQWVENAQKLRA